MGSMSHSIDQDQHVWVKYFCFCCFPGRSDQIVCLDMNSKAWSKCRPQNKCSSVYKNKRVQRQIWCASHAIKYRLIQPFVENVTNWNVSAFTHKTFSLLTHVCVVHFLYQCSHQDFNCCSQLLAFQGEICGHNVDSNYRSVSSDHYDIQDLYVLMNLGLVQFVSKN